MLLVLSFVGFIDAAYLTITHFQNRFPPCLASGCETVLSSSYATVFGVPIALIGALYYMTIFFLVLMQNKKLLMTIITAGFTVSLILLALQSFVIHAYCQYCLVSLATTTLLFITSFKVARS